MVTVYLTLIGCSFLVLEENSAQSLNLWEESNVVKVPRIEHRRKEYKRKEESNKC